MTLSARRALIIGIGNALRGDDMVGLLVARCMRHQCGADTTVIEHDGEGTGLIDCWKTSGAPLVIIADAAFSGAAPGTIYRIEASAEPIPSSFSLCSMHGFGLAEAVELARVIGDLPPFMVIYGIEGARFDYSERIRMPSSPIRRAVRQVVTQIKRDVML